MFYQYPPWSSVIRNHYWNLRYAREYDSARTRKEYRRIEREKKRLQSEGVHPEAIRLLCRHMVNLQNKNAERRWWDFLQKERQKSFEFWP